MSDPKPLSSKVSYDRLRPGKWMGLNGKWFRQFRWVEIVGPPLKDPTQEEISKVHRAALIAGKWYDRKDVLIVLYEPRKNNPNGSNYTVSWDSWQRWAYRADYMETDTKQICEVFDEPRCVHCGIHEDLVVKFGPCMQRPSGYDVVRRWEEFDSDAPALFAETTDPEEIFRVANTVARVERMQMRAEANRAAENAPHTKSRRAKVARRKRIKKAREGGVP